MGYFDQEDNVEEYVRMVEGTDGSALIEILSRHLPRGSAVLELGMGPGVDLALLSEHFAVTGSDASAVFVDRYRATHPDADVVRLDAVEMDIDRRFQGIFSNKVLQHLPKPDAARSIEGQHRTLEPGGLALHSLWHGDSAEQHHGLLFQQYTVDSLTELVGDLFEFIEAARYTELELDDSLYVVLRRREPTA